MDDVKSLSHSKWRCKYHIVFAPKYRGQAIYGKLKADIGKNTERVVRTERHGDNCGRVLPRSYTYACNDPSASECIEFYGILEE